jgi:hypothetical protein
MLGLISGDTFSEHAWPDHNEMLTRVDKCLIHYDQEQALSLLEDREES